MPPKKAAKDDMNVGQAGASKWGRVKTSLKMGVVRSRRGHTLKAAARPRRRRGDVRARDDVLASRHARRISRPSATRRRSRAPPSGARTRAPPSYKNSEGRSRRRRGARRGYSEGGTTATTPATTFVWEQVGLPNVGKSSLFNLLTNQEAAAENFPFCTIDPNEAQCAARRPRGRFFRRRRGGGEARLGRIAATPRGATWIFRGRPNARTKILTAADDREEELTGWIGPEPVWRRGSGDAERGGPL